MSPSEKSTTPRTTDASEKGSRCTASPHLVSATFPITSATSSLLSAMAAPLGTATDDNAPPPSIASAVAVMTSGKVGHRTRRGTPWSLNTNAEHVEATSACPMTPAYPRQCTGSFSACRTVARFPAWWSSDQRSMARTTASTTSARHLEDGVPPDEGVAIALPFDPQATATFRRRRR